MYCTDCYKNSGRGTERALYVYNGKSLCNLHFWDELREEEKKEENGSSK